jgi:hypothetical protein
MTAALPLGTRAHQAGMNRSGLLMRLPKLIWKKLSAIVTEKALT